MLLVNFVVYTILINHEGREGHEVVGGNQPRVYTRGSVRGLGSGLR